MNFRQEASLEGLKLGNFEKMRCQHEARLMLPVASPPLERGFDEPALFRLLRLKNSGDRSQAYAPARE
jgi:hypothetical protein